MVEYLFWGGLVAFCGAIVSFMGLVTLTTYSSRRWAVAWVLLGVAGVGLAVTVTAGLVL